jgi:hypothetical protein
MQGEELDRWVRVQTICALYKTQMALQCSVDLESIECLVTTSVWLFEQATGCTEDFALRLREDDRLPVIQAQDELNGVHDLIKNEEQANLLMAPFLHGYSVMGATNGD